MQKQGSNPINSIMEISSAIEPIEDFNNKFHSVMGDNASLVKNDHLSVFYLEDIVRSLDLSNTPIKREQDLFYLWNGKYWKSITKAQMLSFIFAYISKRGLTAHRSNTIIQGVYSNLCNKLGESNRPLYDTSIQLLNLRNGVLRINSKDGSVRLVKHEPKYHLDYIMDFDYFEKTKNNKWLTFLDDMLPNKGTQKTLQQVIGNLIIRGLKIEVLPFMFGTGGNGKGVVIEVLKGLFGVDNVSSYSLTQISIDEKIRAKIADGKIMNLANENNMGKVDVDMVKTYSSGEPMSARLNYGNPYEVVNYAKFVGSLNRLSVIGGERTEAIKRRLIIIPFMISSKKLGKPMNINLHKEILADKSGLLNWIIEGVIDVLRNEKIYLSDEVKNVLSTYNEDTNPVSQLIVEHKYRFIPKEIAKRNWTKLQDIYNDYKEFVANIGNKPQSRNNFKADLKAVDGVLIGKSNNSDCVNISRDEQYHALVSSSIDLSYEVPKPKYDEYQEFQKMLSDDISVDMLKAMIEDYRNTKPKREQKVPI